jgi:hypothetical protein
VGANSCRVRSLNDFEGGVEPVMRASFMSTIGASRTAGRVCVRGGLAPIKSERQGPRRSIDQKCVLLAAARKRIDDLYSVTSCLKLGQGPRRLKEGSTGEAELRFTTARKDIVFQTREVGTVAALEGYRKVDADNPTK